MQYYCFNYLKYYIGRFFDKNGRYLANGFWSEKYLLLFFYFNKFIFNLIFINIFISTTLAFDEKAQCMIDQYNGYLFKEINMTVDTRKKKIIP